MNRFVRLTTVPSGMMRKPMPIAVRMMSRPTKPIISVANTIATILALECSMPETSVVYSANRKNTSYNSAW